MLKISLMLMVITLLFSTPGLSFAHPDLNYTQSFVKFSNGYELYIEAPEKLKETECDYMNNCFVVTLIVIILIIMVITIVITYRESYLRKWWIVSRTKH